MAIDKIGLDYLNRGLSFNLDYQDYDKYIEYDFSDSSEAREDVLSDIKSYIYDDNKLLYDPEGDESPTGTIYVLLDDYGSITNIITKYQMPEESLKLFTDGYGYIEFKTGRGYVYVTNPNDWFRARFNKDATDKDGYPNFKLVDGEAVELDEDEKVRYEELFGIDAQVQKLKLERLEKQVNQTQTLEAIPDDVIATVPLVLDRWELYIQGNAKGDEGLKKNARIQYNKKAWKVRQGIPIVLANQPPGIDTAALYEVINVQHTGTEEDPIPYDQTMKVFKNKYYSEGDHLYLCTQDSGIPLYNTCEALVGIYFTKIR